LSASKCVISMEKKYAFFSFQSKEFYPRARFQDKFFSVYADSPYYLRAIDTSQCHRFSDIQGTDYKSWACKCAFYRVDSSKCSSRHRRLHNEKCIRNRQWRGRDRRLRGIRGTSSQKRRFKYKVNYIPARARPRDSINGKPLRRNSLGTFSLRANSAVSGTMNSPRMSKQYRYIGDLNMILV